VRIADGRRGGVSAGSKREETLIAPTRTDSALVFICTWAQERGASGMTVCYGLMDAAVSH
jgi:hypothetical protein